jgi:hypothetical protein
MAKWRLVLLLYILFSCVRLFAKKTNDCNVLVRYETIIYYGCCWLWMYGTYEERERAPTVFSPLNCLPFLAFISQIIFLFDSVDGVYKT